MRSMLLQTATTAACRKPGLCIDAANQEEWPVIDAIEMQALVQVVNAAAKFQKGYAPKIVVIGIARKTDMLILKGDRENIRSSEPGTVVDDPVMCPGPTPKFVLLSQAIAKESAVLHVY